MSNTTAYEVPATLHNDIITPLLTDHYQITMAYSYFVTGRHTQIATFELFFRKCPFQGQYAIFAGLHEVLSFVAHFKIPPEHIEYLKTQLPSDHPEFFEWLKDLNCKQLQLFAMEEGSLVFPREPLIRLQGPIGLLQLLETPLLNIINFATLMTTNAARMHKEAGENVKLLEFGLRRAQGPDGGLMASQYSFLGGFHGTSNVLAGFKFGIPISGTMAHSFVTASHSLDSVKEHFINGIPLKQTALEYRALLKAENTNSSELAAFLEYAQTIPKGFLCLVDTYDTLYSGVPNFLCVALALIKAGIQPIGIRLDSGDLAGLSKQARQQFKEASERFKLPEILNFKIAASNDINEDSLRELNKKGHSIDIYGIGTNLVTCQKQPALGGVYKLVELDGVPKHKLSQDPEKSTLPGRKRVFRVWKQGAKYPLADLISREDEILKVGDQVTGVSLTNPNERYSLTVDKVKEISILFWDVGSLIRPYNSLQQLRTFSENEKAEFNPAILEGAAKYPVLATLKYHTFFTACNESVIVSKPL